MANDPTYHSPEYPPDNRDVHSQQQQQRLQERQADPAPAPRLRHGQQTTTRQELLTLRPDQRSGGLRSMSRTNSAGGCEG